MVIYIVHPIIKNNIIGATFVRLNIRHYADCEKTINERFLVCKLFRMSYCKYYAHMITKVITMNRI